MSAQSASAEDSRYPELFAMNQMQAGLKMLWKAAEYARHAGTERWNFAVELSEVREAGLRSSDLRWLIAKGYAEHAHEIDSETGENRLFRSRNRFRFTADSCFALTELGTEFIRNRLPDSLCCSRTADTFAPHPGLAVSGFDVAAPVARGSDDREQLPRWDPLRRELWVEHMLIKRFRVPAPHQEIILNVFEEENWPVRIEDPLPPKPRVDVKRQLHATISSLNRHQKKPLLHFHGDGTGTRVLWELGPRGEALRH